MTETKCPNCKRLENTLRHILNVTLDNLDYKDYNVVVSVPKTSPKSTVVIIEEVVQYLNDQAGCSYKKSSGKTSALIRARLNEGFKYEDFLKVIDHQVCKWKDDPKMSQFLRPETLFGTKFEGYLNTPPKQSQRVTRVSKKFDDWKK